MDGERPKLDLNVKTPNLPRFSDARKIDLSYTLIEPYASAHIFWDKISDEAIYEVKEPLLSIFEKEILQKLEEKLYSLIHRELLIYNDLEDVLDYLDKHAKDIITEWRIVVNDGSYKKIFYYLYRDLIGLNEIEPLLRDPFVRHVKSDGIGVPVKVYHSLYGHLNTRFSYADVNLSASFVSKLSERCGKTIGLNFPLMYGTLPDGLKVNAEYLTIGKGSNYVIRKLEVIPSTPMQLLSSHILSPEMLAYLWILIQNKANILIVGKSSDVRNSLISSLDVFFPYGSRVSNIENIAKEPKKGFLSKLIKRKAPNHAEEKDIVSAIKEAFKKKSDYILVDDLKGKEISAFFHGMMADFGTISTMEASNAQEAIKKLQESPIKLSSKLVNNIDAIVVVNPEIVDKISKKKVLNITEILEVNFLKDSNTNAPFIWDSTSDKFYFKNEIKVLDKLAEKHGLTKESLMKDFQRRTKIILEMYKRGILDWGATQKEIERFYKNPAQFIVNYRVID